MDTTTKLTPRLARWMEKLSEYNFTIEYRPGDTMVVPNSMTRRTQDGYEEKFGEYSPLLPRARSTNGCSEKSTRRKEEYRWSKTGKDRSRSQAGTRLGRQR